jgi:hypothetical protein
MADGAATSQQRADAVRELCDIILSAETAQAAAPATSPAPGTSERCDSEQSANTPIWLVFSAAICRDSESIDAAWELM